MFYKKTLPAIALACVLAACGSDSDDDDAMDTDGNSSMDGSAEGDSSDGDSSDGGNSDGGDSDGGNSDGGQLSGNVTDWGIISLDASDDGVDPSAFFGRFSSEVPIATLEQELNVGVDTCEVSRSAIGEFDPTPDTFDIEFTNLDVGESVVISSPAGTYATLPRFTFNDFIGYVFEDTISGSAPAGLTADIGAPFNTTVSIPDGPALQVSSPTDVEPITPTTQYSWDSNGTSETSIDISASTTDFLSNETISVDCTVIDDGSFQFPADIQSQMGSGFIGSGSISREAFTITTSGNSILVTSHSVSP